MAKVVVDNQNVVAPWRSRFSVLGVAAGAGIAWWALTGLLVRYIIEPLACSEAVLLTVCGDAPSIAGSIAVVLVSVAALLVFATLRYPRPLFIAVGGAALLWSLGLYVAGMAWWEALVWAIVLYILSYALFLLVAQIRSVWVSFTVLALSVVLMRLFVAF